MRLELQVDAAGAETLLERVGRASSGEGVLKAAARILREDVLAQFRAAGDPPWAPLRPGTVAAKRRRGWPKRNRFGQEPRLLRQNGNFGPENVLIRTGALLTSWTQEGDPNHVELIDEASGEVGIGSSLRYAATHQKGGKGFYGSTVPARPIRLRSEAVERIAVMIAREQEAQNGGTAGT